MLLVQVNTGQFSGPPASPGLFLDVNPMNKEQFRVGFTCPHGKCHFGKKGAAICDMSHSAQKQDSPGAVTLLSRLPGVCMWGGGLGVILARTYNNTVFADVDVGANLGCVDDTVLLDEDVVPNV